MSSEPDREPTLWEQKLAVEPGHSAWYVKRFRRLAADGVDIVGEGRTVDAMIDRRSRVLDAGCGSGRLSAALLERLPRGRLIAVDRSAREPCEGSSSPAPGTAGPST